MGDRLKDTTFSSGLKDSFVHSSVPSIFFKEGAGTIQFVERSVLDDLLKNGQNVEFWNFMLH